MRGAPKTIDVFTAISDPTRRRLLQRLGGEERSVQELSDGEQVTLAAISLHLQVLHHAGLVTRRAAGRRRLYRLQPQPLSLVQHWIDGLTAFWNDRLDRLEGIVEEMHGSDDQSGV